MIFKKRDVLLAAVGAAVAASGSSPMEVKAAQETGLPVGSVKIGGVPAEWDSGEFVQEYKTYKTGVPLPEALDFGAFLKALFEGRHVGQKYMKKFSAKAWCELITLEIENGKSLASVVLGEKGMKVCDALFGKDCGPLKSAAKAPKGRIVYLQRMWVAENSARSSFTGTWQNIKSGSEHFSD